MSLASADSSWVRASGELEVNLLGRQVSIDGDRIDLTPREFELLAFLMSHRGRWLRREELLEKVWGFTYGDPATVSVHVNRLRNKIRAKTDHAYIQSRRSRGYSIDPSPDPVIDAQVTGSSDQAASRWS